jgi:cellulose synthase/poly-beta-1,6-N-acetylglucosamine synthase-like glycosyltransferase
VEELNFDDIRPEGKAVETFWLFNERHESNKEILFLKGTSPRAAGSILEKITEIESLILAEIWLTVFYLLTGVPIAILICYGIVIVYYGKKKLTTKEAIANLSSGNFEPLVSVVVATHNEETIIEKKIENLLSTYYPKDKLEIIFADDSNDSTSEIISKNAEQFSNIRLLRFEKRMGYSPSMLAGCSAAKGEIIILNDAASFLDPSVIPTIVDRFRNPKIGVVTGKDVILNVNEEVGKSESLYQRLYNFLRTSETNMDSTFYIKGEATGVRKIAIKNVKASTETFDHTVGLVARREGYKVVYDPKVTFYEYAPATHSGRIQQKTIRAAHLMRVLWRYKGMMFKHRYGKYGSLILPFNFALLTIAPILVLFWCGLLVGLTFLYISFAVYIWAAIAVAILVSLLFSKQLLITFFEFEYSLCVAIYQILFVKKAHDKIDKVASTRRIS